MLSVTCTPGSSTAFERTMRSRSGSDTFGLSKYFLLGQMRSDVPVSRGAQLRIFLSFSLTAPSSKTMRCTPPSRFTSTSSRSESALVTDTPTPCRPPENLYAASASVLENLAPACSSVRTSCTVGIFSSGCRPTGMPRPLSVTVTEPSRCSVTSMRSACPPNASSAALSIASWMMWVGSVVRVYMPGSRCTGSMPRSFLTELSSYFLLYIWCYREDVWFIALCCGWPTPRLVVRSEASRREALRLSRSKLFLSGNSGLSRSWRQKRAFHDPTEGHQNVAVRKPRRSTKPAYETPGPRGSPRSLPSDDLTCRWEYPVCIRLMKVRRNRRHAQSRYVN